MCVKRRKGGVLLKPFEDLGNTIVSKWQETGRNEEAFAEIAATALSESGVLTTVEPHEIVSWIMQSQRVPEQDPQDFGQPPIKLYSGEGFYIQALFWIDGTTSIHEHAFVGAFGVLQGSSVESTYTFTPEKAVSDRLTVGRTKFLSAELLTRGDVHPIHSADRLIHSLFHLDRPSVSIVIRVPKAKSSRPQYFYSTPYLALQNDDLPKIVTIQLQMLESLWVIDRASFWKTAIEISHSCDPYTLHQVLARAFRVSPADSTGWASLLAAAGSRDQWLLDHILPCLQEDRRTEKLTGLRSSVHDPMHRFFLALLLNVPSRLELYRLVEKRFPQERSSALVIRWLGEIFKEKQAGIKLTPSWLFLLDRILEDPEFEHSRATLRELFRCGQEADEEKIRNAWVYLQSLDILAPLMNTTASANWIEPQSPATMDILDLAPTPND